MKKFLQLPVVRILIAILCLSIGLLVGQMLLNALRSALSIQNTGLANLVAFVIIPPLVYVAYRQYILWLEKRDLTELSARNVLPDLGLGFVIGFGLFSLVILTLWLLGLYHVSGLNFVALSLLGALAGAFVSAFAQELIFRAVIYRITEEWLGTGWALVISAFLFGLIHLSSAGATLFSALSVALQAGIVLAAAYALTHRLWLALGLHMAWDFANDGIFGVGVAGQSGQLLHGLFQSELHGPIWLTGGILGVEASVITLIVMLIAGVVMLCALSQRGQWISYKSRRRNETAHRVAEA